MNGSTFPVLKAIGIPTVVLRGEDDQIVPIRINVDRSFSWYRDLMGRDFRSPWLLFPWISRNFKSHGAELIAEVWICLEDLRK
ncbi:MULTISPECIES: hypothetical protein [Rhizobium]|uniref:hypothetical protein n=1 Tax=Rhizobium TaxID=379 RepID=UPI000364F5A3|nr:hypothetical protein [Rhizobium leguminosarum]MVO91264.1 hypothetical protein [Rhizobium leguminosarum bv. phaseoli]